MVTVLGAVVVSVTTPVSGMSTSTSYWVALGIVAVFLLILYFVCGTVQYTDSTGQPQKVRGFWYLILGTDRRVSTSKVQLVLWTIALSYAILVIILHLGRFTASELQPSYLLLLGFPAGAAAGAKAITTSKAAAGTIDKTKADNAKKGLGQGISEVVSNDQGAVDVGDAQYFIFNLVALAAFAVAFAHAPIALPTLPDTLVGLTSVSAAAYVAKKTTAADTLTISAVVPQKVSGGGAATLDIFGTALCGPSYDPAQPGVNLPAVTVGGLNAPLVGAPTQDKLSVTVPAQAKADAVPVQIVTSGGLTDVLQRGPEIVLP